MLAAISVCQQGCYGEPIFNRFFGVALAYLIITLPTFPEPYTDGIFIDPSLAVSKRYSQRVSDTEGQRERARATDREGDTESER
jgi:hypothetical protein